MTKPAPTQNFDAVPDAQVAQRSGNDTTAHDARTNLSNFAVDAMKEASGQGGRAGAEAGVHAIADGVSGGAGKLNKMQEGKDGIAATLGQAVGDGVAHKMIEKGGTLSEAMDSIRNGISFGKRQVTDEDRAEAKKTLGKDLSELIPEADRKVLTDLQGSLIDGDLKKFSDTLKSLPPEQVGKFVKALNDQLNKNEHMGGVELSTDSKGNVLVYAENGNTAISIDPKTGESTLRAVERQNDGSIVLKPGEIINRQAGDVMKDLGNEATRSLTQFPIHFDQIKPMPMPMPRPLPPFRDPGWGDKIPQHGDGSTIPKNPGLKPIDILPQILQDKERKIQQR